MANSTLARYEHFYQELTEKFNATARGFSQAWTLFEFTREALQQLMFAHRLLMDEKNAEIERLKQRISAPSSEDIL